MTENEIIKRIEDLAGDYKCFDEKISHEEALMLCNLLEEIQQYRAIGTVEGYKRAIEISKENFRLSMEYKAKVQQYEAIGTIEECRDAVERMKPKKPIFKFEYENGTQFYDCPVCGRYVTHSGVQSKEKYCSNCGNKLDWSK